MLFNLLLLQSYAIKELDIVCRRDDWLEEFMLNCRVMYLCLWLGRMITSFAPSDHENFSLKVLHGHHSYLKVIEGILKFSVKYTRNILLLYANIKSMEK